MTQFSERAAEKLAPDQAAELVRVIEFQARWENMRCEPVQASDRLASIALQARQKAYDAFQSRLSAYSTKYRVTQVPEPTMNTPERVGAWCRAVRALLWRAEKEAVEAPVHLIAKARRLADRVATRLGKEPIGASMSIDSLAAAIHDVSAVVAWCERLVANAATVILTPSTDTESREKVA